MEAKGLQVVLKSWVETRGRRPGLNRSCTVYPLSEERVRCDQDLPCFRLVILRGWDVQSFAEPSCFVLRRELMDPSSKMKDLSIFLATAFVFL